MKKNLILAVALLLGVVSLSAQELGDYKYIVVPQKFEFQDEAGEYDVNALTRFLFIKYGFDAYMENEELPADLNENGCNTLYARATVSGFLSIKALISLVNCRGKEVFVLPEGKSKIKEFKAGHQDAFRDAFEELEEEYGYTYSDEIVDRAELIEEDEDEAAELVPEIRKKQESKVVAVTAVVKNTGKEIKEEVSTAIDAETTTAPSTNESVIEEDISTVLTSEDGSFSMKATTSGFDVYEGSSKIGTAVKTSAGSYLVSTSEFTGVGYYNGTEFTVEREIKGVSGLVKMIFTKK
ncbi:hypothetical protein DSM02_3869 [Leeuwenhoekiella polynyae]|uniref:Uncharacterized protein n=2 Tax=Leeuwenhoekiella polynyae TaxID=1550906 RepID=A0A4Q0NPZ7_9FLAO|nr:hypothetical protein DSM02_3869 [Leeuwenhoekiella polynyae]